MICIIDYGTSNIRSIYNAIKYLGYNPIVTKDYKEIIKADKLILPGVGAFKHCIDEIKNLKLYDIIKDHIINKQKPYLGICVGMQILATKGMEVETSPGLGIFEAVVRKIDSSDVTVPHIGWNSVNIVKDNILFKHMENNTSFYFIHSFYFDVNNEIPLTYTNYGINFVSSISKDNVYGVQFHPEKSQDNGLKLLDNFITYS